MADTLLGGIVINEILVDPNGSTNNFDTDGNGTASATDEYIELYNTSSVAIDISGLELWDGGVGQWFTFPPGTILQPGAHAMVMSGVQSGGSLPTGDPGDLFFDAGRGAALINNGGDNVTVYDPTNDEFIQATFNGDELDDPTLGGGGYSGFSVTATRNGTSEDFGDDTDGLSLQRLIDGSDNFVTDGPTPGTTNVCFADGTAIRTPHGERRVEDLRPGDQLVTLDHGVQEVAWVFGKTWSPIDVAISHNLCPVRISKGSLGNGLPERHLRLSRQHRVLVKGQIARRMFDAPEVLIPAKDLLGLPGVSLEMPTRDVTYYHIMLSRHEVLFADGAPCESLYLGSQAIEAIPAGQLDELLTVLGLTRRDLTRLCERRTAARPIVQGPRARQLIMRHVKNRKPLIGPMEQTQLRQNRKNQPQICDFKTDDALDLV
ncbi:MAG: Hint domain-containing protein [Pseudomonadota bacterium]